jgi:DNA-binding NarL/FixJ family response regulator
MPIRILIADDNDVFRSAFRQLLEGSYQWEIIEARDGQEAVSKAVELRPNVVILDLAMPIKDGLTSAREISHLLPDTPIMMCTMHMSPHLEAEAYKSGIRKVLSKSESVLLVPAIRQLLAPVPSESTPLSAEPIPPVVSSTAVSVSASSQSTASDDPALSSAPLPKNVA